ncbi:MAG: iron-binding protein [Campylobacteraceae bacterium]|nr:iron-binding protein [Campylobacteraceae bacterium]
MKLNEIYQKKHELWLKILYASFAISNETIKSELCDMAGIEFRHLKWLSNKLKEQNEEYDYEKSDLDIQKSTNYNFLNYLVEEIKEVKGKYDLKDNLFARMDGDENYFLQRLAYFLAHDKYDDTITAFNRDRVYKAKKLSKKSTDALTIFLFEESYKEYELIMIYAYMQNYTNDIELYNVYQDLVDESMYHLKCFGNMKAQMGILAIPRTIIKSLYKREDIKQFFLDGIDEEKAAKEECIKLSTAVQDEELSKFFDFINFQENYHMELMQKAIKVL